MYLTKSGKEYSVSSGNPLCGDDHETVPVWFLSAEQLDFLEKEIGFINISQLLKEDPHIISTRLTFLNSKKESTQSKCRIKSCINACADEFIFCHTHKVYKNRKGLDQDA